MTLRVELVAPDGEIWSGRARMVIAKTLDGDLGVLTGHSPVLGILAEGSLVRILAPEAGEVMALRNSACETKPANLDPRLSRVAAGIYRLEGQLLVVLDVDRVLDIRNGALAA